MNDTIRQDLENKLHRDILTAINHFAEMCEVMEIKDQKIVASIIHILIHMAYTLVHHVGIKDADFMRAVQMQVDEENKK